MPKIYHPTPRIMFIAFALFFIACGWYSHVFTLWTIDVLHKAKMCDETNCQRIRAIATEIQDYELEDAKPVRTPPKIKP